VEPRPSQKKVKVKARAESMWSPLRSLVRHASSEFCLVVLIFLLLTVFRCCNNKIACIWESSHGKACAACVKAKQHCGGFVGEERWL
jgi:hypothetical protein